MNYVNGLFCGVGYIPETIKQLENWCVWRLDYKEEGGKPTKIPYNANTGYRASSTNPATWATFERATQVYDYLKPRGAINGLGFFFKKEDGLVFIDIDHCFIDGKLSDFAEKIVKMFPDSYWEVSQSGEGLHCITKGTLPRNFKNSKTGLEMYDHVRYVAFTGNSLNPVEPAESQQNIDELFTEYCTSTTPEGKEVVRHELREDVKDILAKAKRNPHNGKRVRMLFDGKWKELGYKTQSEADIAFCQLLAFWCNRNENLIDEIFCCSGLYRNKWKGYYRESTLSRAVGRTAMDKKEYMDSMDAHRNILTPEEFKAWKADKHRKDILTSEV